MGSLDLRLVALAIALSFISYVLPAKGQSNGPACSLLRYASVDMRTEPEGRVTVPLAVNGRTMPFMIDTGGWFGGISSAVATAMHLPPRPFMTLTGGYVGHLDYVSFYGGQKMTQEVEADSYALGPLVAKNVEIPVMPTTMLADNVDGIIGGNVLANYDIDLDFYNERLNVFSAKHCPTGVVYWTHDTFARIPFHLDKETWQITIPVTLDGQSFRALLDTGSATSTTTLDHARRLFGWADNDYRVKQLRNGSYRFPFSEMSFGNVIVNNPEIELIPRKYVVGGAGAEVLLGMDVLRQLHLYIAYNEQALYATAAEAH